MTDRGFSMAAGSSSAGTQRTARTSAQGFQDLPWFTDSLWQVQRLPELLEQNPGLSDMKVVH